MRPGGTGKRSKGSVWERARHVLRHAWRNDLPYEVQEVHDPPVVGRRVTDEHGSHPDQAPSAVAASHAAAGPARQTRPS